MPVFCGWGISGLLPFASKVSWCTWCFQGTRKGAGGLGGREEGVQSGSQRMYALIPEIPSDFVQLPGFRVQLPYMPAPQTAGDRGLCWPLPSS